MSVNTLPSIQYSLDVIQEEARQLVHKSGQPTATDLHTLPIHPAS